MSLKLTGTLCFETNPSELFKFNFIFELSLCFIVTKVKRTEPLNSKINLSGGSVIKDPSDGIVRFSGECATAQ